MSNLPQNTKTSAPTLPARASTRPLFVISALILTLGGGISALYGAGVLSYVAIVFGLATFLAQWFFRRPTSLEILVDPDAVLKERRRHISKTKYLENVDELGEKAAGQLEQISGRHKKFGELLATKFNPGEITHSRYLAAAEQTYLAVVDNLHSAAAALNSLSAMPAGESAERDALRAKQITVVKELFSFNDRALTEFDRVSTALAQVQTLKGQSDAGLEIAMGELAELAERAKKYSV